MSEQLWSNERIQDLISSKAGVSFRSPNGIARIVAFAIRDDYEAKIAELEKTISDVKAGNIFWDGDLDEWLDSETYGQMNNDE